MLCCNYGKWITNALLYDVVKQGIVIQPPQLEKINASQNKAYRLSSMENRLIQFLKSNTALVIKK